MKSTTRIQTLVLLAGFALPAVAAEPTSSEFLYEGGGIRDLISRAELILVGEFGEFAKLDRQIGNGDSYSLSHASSFEVQDVLKGDMQAGQTINLEIADANVRYLNTDLSVSEYRELVAARAKNEVAENLAILQRFEEMSRAGEISESMLERLRTAHEQAYGRSLERAAEAVGNARVQVWRSSQSTMPERRMLVASGEVVLVLLTRLPNSFGEPTPNSYALFPSVAYGLYKDLELAYILGLMDEVRQP